MNGYPFAGPGGQKTLHQQAAEKPASEYSDAQHVACVNVFAECLTPQQAYSAIMEFDNR